MERRSVSTTVLALMGCPIHTSYGRPRRRTNNQIFSDDDRTETSAEEYKRINKGLAMELLSSCLFTCLDSPSDVYSACAVRIPNQRTIGAEMEFAPYAFLRTVRRVGL